MEISQNGLNGLKISRVLYPSKSSEIEEFIDQPFDLLISYYKPNQLELNLVTASSKANFKIGITNEDSRLHDLTIDIEPSNTDVFKIELIKYLTQLNRL